MQTTPAPPYSSQQPQQPPEWVALCLSKPVRTRAVRSALLVGAVLILINHGDALWRGRVDAGLLFQMGLTALVPYVVSTVSSVSTILSLKDD